MKARGESSRGFTIIELMIVVGIVCLLASVATPLFLDYRAHSKTSEAMINLKLIAEGVQVYFGALHQDKSGYCPRSVGLTPPTVSKAIRNSSAEAIENGWFRTDDTWVAIGFSPASNFFYSYQYDSPCPDGPCVKIEGEVNKGYAKAVGDLDGDGDPSEHVIELTVENGVMLDSVVYSLDPTE